jgi:hypothetical protein
MPTRYSNVVDHFDQPWLSEVVTDHAVLPPTESALDPIPGDAVDVAHAVVWATVTTVGPNGRPRSRVMHPIWLADAGAIEGLVLTRPTPLKQRHLTAHPVATCAYLGDDHSFAIFDCDARLVDDAECRRRAWEAFGSAPPPLGYDPATIFPEGPASEALTVLRLRPHRVRVGLGAAMARGEPPQLWRAAGDVSARPGA